MPNDELNEQETVQDIVSELVPASEYPEHEKLTAVQPFSQKIGEFVEWLNPEEIYLCENVKERGRHGQEELTYCRTSIRNLLAKFFGIDQDILEAEKARLIDHARSAVKDHVFEDESSRPTQD